MTVDHPADVTAAAEARLVRKISRRLLWFLFVAFCCSFLDRINIGFAALAMNKDLGLTATAYGLATTIFYIGYIACEIPSNLLLARLGARIWIARIMITWGIASAATMFAVGPRSLYALRLAVGIAEAGFLPGALLYITYWFPNRHRGRATALFFIAQPITSALGAVASGYLLTISGALGLKGWQWLFLLEGIPSILLGLVAFFYLTDSPAKARWLKDDERTLLATLLAEERTPARSGTASIFRGFRELLQPAVIALAISYFCLVNTLNAITTWVPQIVKTIAPGSDFLAIGVLTAIPSVVTVAGMIAWSNHSDARQERRWHTALPMFVGAIGWLLTAYGSAPPLRLVGIVLASTGALTAMTVFWTMPARCLTADGRPAGIAFVNMIGLVGAAVSPLVFGLLRDSTGSFASGLVYAAVMLTIAGVIVLSIRNTKALRVLEVLEVLEVRVREVQGVR